MALDTTPYEEPVANVIFDMLRPRTSRTVARQIARLYAPRVLATIQPSENARIVYAIEPLLDEAQTAILGYDEPDEELSTDTAFEIFETLRDLNYPGLERQE